MDKVKIIDKKTGAIKEVKKSLAGDYIGTGNFEIYEETKKKSVVLNKNIYKEAK